MIVEARADHAEQIARLHIASWQATYAQELSHAFLQHQDLAARAAEWRRQLAAGVAVLLVEEGGETAGFVACGFVRSAVRDPAEWEIYNLHVAPSRQGGGIGSKLFDAAAWLGGERSARELVLWVVKTNRTARAFYEHKGMRWDGGEQEHPLGPGEKLHEVRYRMNLRPSEGRARGPTKMLKDGGGAQGRRLTVDTDVMRSDCGKPGLNRRQFLNLASVATAGTVIARSPAALAAGKVSWRADGTGMARIGLLVPSHDFNPESEIWAMAPKGVVRTSGVGQTAAACR